MNSKDSLIIAVSKICKHPFRQRSQIAKLRLYRALSEIACVQPEPYEIQVCMPIFA